MIPRLLVIAGSDPSAGAGIQADLKTAQALGVYCQTAITAVTVQNTHGVQSVNPLDAGLVAAQVKAALDDIGADAIKIGMLGNGAIVRAVADVLEGRDIPLVLDTVIASSSGASLLDDDGIALLKTRLIPRSLLVTPNIPECAGLTGIAPQDERAVTQAALVFQRMGARNVLFKSGHADGDVLRDVLWTGGAFIVFDAPRQDTRHTHGTGCTLATAIACGVAQGRDVTDAVSRAHDYLQNAIRTAPGLGAGAGPLNHR